MIKAIARFKEEPSINKIITEEKEQVGRTQAKDDLRSRRDSIFASKALNYWRESALFQSPYGD